MKTRFSYFIKTYFYFNNQERKGIVSLAMLVVLMQIGNFLFAAFSNTDLPKIEVSVLNNGQHLFVENKLDEAHKIYSKSAYFKKPFLENKPNRYNDSDYYKKKKATLVIEINTADSVELVRLPKIGPVLAGRIVNYRERLGGFTSLNQLKEIWGFKEDFLYDLEGKITLDPKLAKPILLNSIALVDLKKHPYFKYTLSQALVNYRIQHGPFKQVEELKNLKMVNDSIYQLILPYCVIDK